MRIRARSVHAFFLVGILVGTSGVSQVLQNPAKPASENAGRVLKLKEVWRITDEAGKFFLKWPSALQIAGDGSVLLADEGELLKFSSEGKFLQNLYKEGQGPGEIASNFIYSIGAGKIYVWDTGSAKLFWTDLDGRLIHQTGLTGGWHSDFLGVWGDGFLFIDQVPPPVSEQNDKLFDFPLNLNWVSSDGAKSRNLHVFKTKIFLTPRSRTTWDGSFFAFSPDSGRIYASCAREYLIEVFDCGKERPLQAFKREYRSVPYKEKGWENSFYKTYNVPKIRIERDIEKIFVAGKNLWVQTSTKDAAKGSLFDLFNENGRFIDSFYIGLGRTLMACREGDLFIQEKNPDETYRIVKYRIEK